MFWNKKTKEIDKLILGDENIYKTTNVIDVKIECKEQLFSTYSFSGDKLNTEFSEYISDKAKSVPIKEQIKINIHTKDDIEVFDVEQSVKSHFCAEYKECKKEVNRLALISLIMLLFGIVALTTLILVEYFTDNIYITSIAEIAAWVFIWEAVDIFFLQRAVAKAKCLLIQRIYTASIEICKEEI